MELKELLENRHFIGYLNENIRDFRSQRNTRKAKPGYRFKRDFYDRMTEEQRFNSDFMLKNIPYILNATSDLNAETRNAIKWFFEKSMHDFAEKHPDLFFESVV